MIIKVDLTATVTCNGTNLHLVITLTSNKTGPTYIIKALNHGLRVIAIIKAFIL